MANPPRLLFEILIAAVAQGPQRTAIVADARSYTYATLYETAVKLANLLRDRGLEPGDRVSIFMNNGFIGAASIFGVSLAGGVFIVNNPQLKPDGLRAVLEDSGARILLTESRLARVYEPGVAGLGLDVLVDGGDQTWPDLQDAIAGYDNTLQPASTIPLDLAALIYTSGSTGVPKGVMMTHQAMVFTVGSIVQYLGLHKYHKVLTILPLAFTYGLYQLLGAVATGACLVLERGFTYPGQVVKRIHEEQPEVLAGVPTIYQTLVRLSRKKHTAFSSVRVLTNAAAALPATLIESIEAIFPNAELFKMYGLTECTRGCYLDPQYLHGRPSSVGKAIPGTQAIVLDTLGQPTAPGEVGKLHLRGPHIMLGYWGQPAKTSAMLRPSKLSGERMLCTQDWFKRDEEGFLYFVARSDDIIKTRGEKVSPVQVEHVLHAIEGIREACVIGVCDELLGQKIRAYVSLLDGAQLDERQIRLQCAQHLEAYMIPDEVVFEAELPKTGSQKVHKQALRDRDGIKAPAGPVAPLD